MTVDDSTWDAADHLHTRLAVELYLADAVPTSDNLEQLADALRTALRAIDRLMRTDSSERNTSSD